MPPHVLAALVPVTVLMALHLTAGHIRRAVGGHERTVVSAAGGISVAYVFLHLLPEVAAGSGTVEESLAGLIAHVPVREIAVFVVALAGFTAFYLAERYAVRQGSPRQGGAREEAAAPAFRVHVAAFVVYNAAIAYTLPGRLADDAVSAAVFTVAVGVHVLVVDRGLAGHYPRRYRRAGRYVVAGAVAVGWGGAAVAAPTSALTVALMTALVAGSVLLTVFQEELPHAGQSRLGAFLAGLGGYSALLVVMAAVGGRGLPTG